MNLLQIRRLLFVCLTIAIFTLPSFAAGRRRAVAHPSPAGPALTAKITGTVIDAVTNQPVVAVVIESANASAVSDASGKFVMDNVVGYGAIEITASRSGYVARSEKLTTGGDHSLTLRLQPTPTVRVRKVDGTTYDLDFESLKFGYAVPFSGYRDGADEAFCLADGSQVVVDRSQIKRITGPAVRTTKSGCCSADQLLKVHLELKNGTSADAFFLDSCFTTQIDLIGREHVNAKFQYIRFTEIAEVVFP